MQDCQIPLVKKPNQQQKKEDRKKLNRLCRPIFVSVVTDNNQLRLGGPRELEELEIIWSNYAKPVFEIACFFPFLLRCKFVSVLTKPIN